MSEFYTYPRYAQWLKDDLLAHNDPGFAVRALKQVVSHIRSITEDYQFEQAHAKPDSTGNPEWDRVIRAAAEMTYADRFPGCMPSWAAEGDEPPVEWFFPTGRPSRFAFNLERTPVAFLNRRVRLGEGNLRTARDAEQPWI